MSEIVGVYHNEKNLNEHLLLFDEMFKRAPKTVILELPPNWESVREANKDSYFFGLAEIYERKGAKVVPADINNKAKIEAINFIKKKTAELKISGKQTSFKELLEIFKQMVKYHFYYKVTFFSKARRKERNEGFLQVVKKNPEADFIIVGDAHGNFIKRNSPESKYTQIVIGHRENVVSLFSEMFGLSVQADQRICKLKTKIEQKIFGTYQFKK